MVNNTSSLATLAILSSTATFTSAFVQVGRPSVIQRSQHLKQLYDAPDGGYLEQLGAPSTTSSSDTTDHEQFQRTLLEAKIAYDAIDNALATSEDIDFDAPVLNNPQSSSGPLKKEPIVDDECYLGKEGQLDECVDFDPITPITVVAKQPVVSKRQSTATEDTDFDAPVLKNPAYATPLTNDPIVNDECYLGKDGQLDECADFDPLVTAVSAAAVSAQPKVVVPQANKQVVKQSSGELGIVPINEATIEFTAGLLGGTAGLVLGGPILGVVGASTCNYLSRKDDANQSSTTTSPKKVVDTASLAALNVYNFVAQFESDNKILDSTFKFVGKMLEKVKESEAGETVSKVESTLGGIVNKVEDLNDEYDLVGGTETLLGAVGGLIEVSVDKVVELNGEYKLTERVARAVKDQVNKK